MKILFTHLYNRTYGMGGAEKVVLDMIHAVKLRYPDIEIHCCVNGGHMAEQIEKEGIPVSMIHLEKRKTIATLRMLTKIIHEFKPDVIHSHHRYTSYLLDVFFKSKASIIHTEHVLRQDKKLFFRYGHKATGVSESVRQNLIEYYGVPEKDAITIHNGVVAHKADPMIVESIRAQHLFENIPLKALLIGRLEEQKGHTYLIDAIKHLSIEERKRLRIFLAGDGHLEIDLKAQMKKIGVEGNFIFMGHTDRVPEYLEICDFVVLPSLWEGMPLSVLEAYSAGKAVLATNIPGTREVMLDGVTGYMVSVKSSEALAQGLKKILTQPEKLISMGENARECWQESYSFDQTIDAYYQLYQSYAKS
jgi:glycosyltransferase involved in cell wall biosynthesis